MTPISRRLALAAAASLMLTAGVSARERPARPNIVYILADDLGWGDLRAYNPQSAIPTPNLDRLAAQGIRFEDMHSPSAVCSPTRYGILTGRYAWRTRLKKGVLWGYDTPLIEPGRLTVPGLLKQAGYHTAGIGKWHLGLGSGERTDYSQPLRPGPVDQGFDYYYGIPASLDMQPYVYFENDKVVSAASTETPGRKEPRGVFWRQGAAAPDFDFEQVVPHLAQKAVDVIDQRAQAREKLEDQPFFLYVALPSPHTPWLPLPEYRGKSGAGDYGDYVVQTDAVIGQIFEALERNGQADNTLFIVTSDNGADWNEDDINTWAHRANAGFRGRKADIWEAGHRVPFIARWPGRIRPGSVHAHPGSLTDLFATVAAITGQAVPQDAAEDSVNLWPAFNGSAKGPVRDTLISHSADGVFAIRHGAWKLIEGLGSGGFTTPKAVEPREGGPKGQLYDLSRDPGEVYNLYDARPDIVADLTARLERYRSEGRSHRG